MNEIFQRHAQNHHEVVSQWKNETGKKVFGYFCCTVPEEIIFAADALPVRIVGTSDPLERAQLHVPPNSCPFARSCLDAGMRGLYDYLDGVVIPTTCDVVSVMDYFWDRYVTRPQQADIVRGRDLRPFVYHINYPEKTNTAAGLRFYENVIMEFKQNLERALNRVITDEDLSRAISVYNDQKMQMRRMYDLRQQNPPGLSGYEAWQISFAASVMPKDQHAVLLRQYLDTVETEKRKAANGVRVYLVSGPLDPVDAEVIKAIEQSGGQVVTDDSCYGTRSFWHPIDTKLPPLEAICRRSLAVACPRSTSDARIPENRWGHINETAKGYDVQGAIFYTLKYCDGRSAEIPHLMDKVRQEWHVPVLPLEGDHTLAGIEQMRERIEAFTEMIAG
jgi:benzoyl-CoA reductase/2-hydroxyglutaryl-CoA dehydratase subunit BcrC/BadD/HgdB